MGQPSIIVVTARLVAVFIMMASLASGQFSGQSRVVSLSGNIFAKPPGGDFRPLQVNDSISAGYELMTGENAEAVIQTGSGSTIRVYPDTRLIYSEPSSGLRGLIELFLGSVKVQVERLSGRPNPHRMATPTAVIAVRGTTFSVFVDEESTTMVAVEEGLVSVANRSDPAAEVLLRRGERTWVRLGMRPAQVQLFRGPSERADLLPARARGRAAAALERAPGQAMRAAAKAEGMPDKARQALPLGPPGLMRRAGTPRGK